MPYIEFSDFGKMTGEYEPVKLAQLPGGWGNGGNLHKEILNAMPAAASMFSPTLSPVFNLDQFADTTHPFAVSRNLVNVNGTSTLNAEIQTMVPSYALGNVLAVTQSFDVYALDTSTTLVGTPAGGVSSQQFVDIELFNGKVWASYPGVGASSLFFGAIASATTWTGVTGTTTGSSVAHLMRAFGSKLYVTDANGSSTDRRLVKMVDSSNTLSAGLDLGTDWYVNGLQNYDNKYLAVFASRNQNSYGQDSSCLFLWNGQAGSSYDYAISFRGLYAGSAVRDGNLYVFVNESADLGIYLLNGLQLQLLRRVKSFTCPSPLAQNPKSNVSAFGRYFFAAGTYRSTVGDVYSLLAYSPESDEGFVLFSDSSKKVYGTLALNDSAGGQMKLYLSVHETGGSQPNLKSYLPSGDGPTQLNSPTPLYQSNVVELPEGRVKLESLEIWYSSPPPTSGDSFSVTISYRDDYDDATSYSGTYKTLQAGSEFDALTYTTTGKRYTRRDGLGVTCNKLKVRIGANVGSTDWKPIIYRARINYSVVKYQK